MAAAIEAKEARYIKLGTGNRLAEDCIEKGLLRLGFDGVPHDLCLAGGWKAVQQMPRKPGKSAGPATNQAQQIKDFYTLGSDTLWITLWDGKLWWTFAKPGVLQDKDHDYLTRYRRTVGPWCCTDIGGQALYLRDFSTKLT